jgi:hypothetical protein
MVKVYKIHPAIGVARVGNSPNAFFIGPETPDAPGVEIAADGSETPIQNYKANGAIKRQGARFRVYEYDRDANGKLTLNKEITADLAKIEWKVDLVNRKAALDHVVDPGIDPDAAPAPRNMDLVGPARTGLIIQDPRNRTIAGMNQSGVLFDKAAFLGKPVFLGELRTDKSGRLIVLGGRGVSESVPPGQPLNHFANNDRWHDDVSDGPVTATITFPDQLPKPVDVPAWVAVAPPDFAPQIGAIVTLYDVAFEAARQKGLVQSAAQPSFRQHILPVLQRASGLRWSHSFQTWDALSRDYVALAKTDSASASLRAEATKKLMNPPFSHKVIPAFLKKYFDQYKAGNFVSDLATAPPAGP